MTRVGEGLFAAVLDDLCRHPPGRRRRMSNVELSAAIRERGGDIGHAYIAQLRKGQKDNPTRQAIEDLAGSLDVHPAYFVGGRRELAEGEAPSWRHDALRTLFETSQGTVSPEDVAAAISGNGRHGSISASYIRELLNGVSDNPRLKHILGLAEYFDVPPAYFFDDRLARWIDSERADLVQLRELGVVEFVTRLAGKVPELSQQTRRATIQAIADALEPGKYEGWFIRRDSEPRYEQT
jgi:transcriptional regulator with XRE-family HTH domain